MNVLSKLTHPHQGRTIIAYRAQWAQARRSVCRVDPCFEGLSQAEAELRLKKFEPNQLTR